jgi:hypothetical protein
MPATVAARVSTEATERSIPPVRMIIVIPTAMMPVIAISWPMTNRLVLEPKFRAKIDIPATRIVRKISAGSSRRPRSERAPDRGIFDAVIAAALSANVRFSLYGT